MNDASKGGHYSLVAGLVACCKYIHWCKDGSGINRGVHIEASIAQKDPQQSKSNVIIQNITIFNFDLY